MDNIFITSDTHFYTYVCQKWKILLLSLLYIIGGIIYVYSI